MAYNKAIKYLREKFGTVPSNSYYKDSFKNYEIKDQRLILLVDQYYLGITAKRKLENLIEEMGL